MTSRLTPILALATLALLTACGGGGGGTGSGTTPQAVALFDAGEAAALQTLTGATVPGETATANDARRRAQGRRIGWTGRRASDPDVTAAEAAAVAFSRRHADVSLRRTLLARYGLVVHGAQDAEATVRSIGTTLDHAGLATVTLTDHPTADDGIYVRTDARNADSRPDASATWTGLMLGADRTSRDLLMGDTTITYDFGDQTVDVNFTGIVNLDTAAPHTTRAESFADIAVAPDGTWTLDSTAPRHIEGRLAGPDHAEAVGLFWTPAMLGAYGARKETP